VIHFSGQSDPELALQLAREYQEPAEADAQNYKSRLLAEAAFWQVPTVAEGIWRQAVPVLDPQRSVKYAARIVVKVPSLGRELYQMAREKMETMEEDAARADGIDRTDPIEFATYEAQFEPARARYRLEVAEAKTATDPNARYTARKILLAMARVDPARAVEIAQEQPHDKQMANSVDDLAELAHWLWDQKDENGNEWD